MVEPSTCPACQSALSKGGQFCGYCGFKLSAISDARHQALADRISSDALDPLPALSGLREADQEADTRADHFADTFAAGQQPDLALAPTVIRPDQPADPLEQTAPALRADAFEHDPALDDTALHGQKEPTSGAVALLKEGPDKDAVLAPAAALPGTAATGGLDKTAGGTLSYGASPVMRPAPLTAEARAANESGRRMNRFPIKVDVSYTSSHNFFIGVIENVSSGGIFVATDEPGDIGEEYEINFTVPGINKTCQAVCQVRWIRQASAAPEGPSQSGMGLKFVKLDAMARAAIELFLNHREPILHEEG